MAKEYYLPYLGKIISVAQAHGPSLCDSRIIFTTSRDEALPAAVYSISPEQGELHSLPLPAGGRVCVQQGDNTWVADTNNGLHLANFAKATIKPLGKAFDEPIVGLACLSGQRLAVLGEKNLFVVSNKGAVLQSLSLENTATCLASDVSGDWCAVGTQSGKVYVFTAEGQAEFALSEAEKLHQGAVESLLFEPDVLRFYSSGTDRKLFSTYARGKLEAEDRGRDGAHQGQISAMLNTPGERFITGSHDKTCKAWVRNNKSRPATVSSLPKVMNLSLVKVYERPHLVVQGNDNTLRLFMLDTSGKIGDQTIKFYDAYRKAEIELDESKGYKAEARERALQDLSGYADIKAIDILAQQVTRDSDHLLRVKAAELLVETGHPSVVALLFPLLKSDQEAVREVAFRGLQKLNLANEFANLDAAIASEKNNIAFLALERFAELARNDDRARNKLEGALNTNPYEARAKALHLLEALPSDNPAQADITALGSRKADLRQIALVQLHQRGLLSDSRVLTSIKRVFDDADAGVRRSAFLVALLAKPGLADAIRARHQKIHADLFDIECFELSAVFSDKPLSKKSIPKLKQKAFHLENEDYAPLLQAMASKHIDMALLGVSSLALLSDPRAYGFLLQLSTENSDAVKIAVCHAFAALDDQRATSRLVALCNSESVQVRDAAFSAISELYRKTPARAVQHGLLSKHADVRKRAQQTLIHSVKKSPPKENSVEWNLLFERLNDNDAAVRGEAFKTLLNLQLGGGEGQTLELLRQSIHADIRREVQTEAMAEIAKPWAMPLLLRFIDDADQALRHDTLNFLLKRSRGRDLSPLALAVKCSYADTRYFAINELSNNPSQEKQQLLYLALEDPSRDNRKAAIAGIVSEDNRPLLLQALENSYSDVRLAAALALARIGEPLCEPVLLAWLQQKEPEKKADKAEWQSNVIAALNGLALLGSESSQTPIQVLLDSPYKAIQQACAEALFWTSSDYQSLVKLRNHENKKVQQYACLASAIGGNKTDALSVIASDLPVALRLGVIVKNLDKLGELLLDMLDSSDNQGYPVLLVIFLLAMSPQKMRSQELLLTLGSQRSINKLIAAITLEHYGDRAMHAQIIQEYLGIDIRHSEWQLAYNDIHTLSYLVNEAHFSLLVKTLEILEALWEDTHQHWNLLWATHQSRYQQAIHSLMNLPAQTAAAENFTDLVFGTYVGLLREPARNNRRFSKEEISVKCSTINRLNFMAGEHPFLANSIETVIFQMLGDSVQEVRERAFDILQPRIAAAVLAEECLQTKHVDLGVKGLALLTKGASEAQTRQILGKVVSERQDYLALEATKMLLEIDETLAVCKLGLASHNKQVRHYCAELLLKDYADNEAKKLLYSALDSPYKDVSGYVAAGLAYQRDNRAIDTLMDLLKQEQNNRGRKKCVDLLVRIGSEEAAAALLDLVESDLHSVSSIWPLHGIGQMRVPAHIERLLKLSEDEIKSADILYVLFVISGYDQSIQNADEEQVLDNHWQQKQFPRHDTILAKTMLRGLYWKNLPFLNDCLPGARWAPSPELHAILETLAKFPDDAFRNRVLEAIGWRVEHRGGRADALLEALEHKSPDTRFIAAEALAKLGRGEGFTILLAAVELMQNLDYRRRAVSALGKLADPRSVDLLLKLAGDSEHALQDAAVEAIGHLGDSEKAPEIFSLLQRYVDSENLPLVTNAVKGLRWLNTRDAWQLIRKNGSGNTCLWLC